MQQGIPSRTARAAAKYRAEHQLLEQGRIFSDPLAVPIYGEEPSAIIAQAEGAGLWQTGLRFFIAVRTRFAEDALERALRAGVSQLVVLGAGLDTFAYRNPFPALKVFEVDHPATQAWKRERLAAASIAIPSSLRFVSIDFEREQLRDVLAAAGFQASKPSFFVWLGVIVYLTRESSTATLRFIGSLPGGAHVVFDYANPPEARQGLAREVFLEGAARAHAAGETWVNYYDTAELHAELRTLGFSAIEDLGAPEIAARYVPDAAPPESQSGPHLLHASAPAR